MTSQNSPPWDFGRFVKTLSYFGAIPFLSNMDWFQRWFGSRSNPTVNSGTIVNPTATISAAASDSSISGSVLVVAAGNIVNKVEQQLTAQGYKQITPITNPADLPADLSQHSAAICWADTPDLAEASHRVARAAGLGLTHLSIFDFAHPSADLQEIWGALDDVVMGGVSQSSIRLEDGVAYFSGVVSTANSGGFASIRTRNLEPPLNLAGYDGVELRLKGDGKRYKFMLRTETRWDGVAHCYSFDTAADQWITVRIPFAELIPVFRARTIDSASLDLSQVCAWQLMLSKFEYDGALNPHFEPGFFQLQIASIQVYKQASQPRFILVASEHTADFGLIETLKTNDIPYTIIHPSALTDQPGGQTLRLARHTLDGQVSIEDVAALCVAALDHPGACNAEVSVTAGEGECAVGDWACLFQTLSYL